MNETLNESQRQALAMFWAQRARGERTTAVAFEHMLDDLVERNDRTVLCDMARRAVSDEHRHALACMRWAEHFNEAPLPAVEPHSEKPMRFAGANDDEQRVLRIVFGCCFCETVAVHLLSTLHPLIRHAELHRQNRGHLRDEVQHSRLGWAFVGQPDLSGRDKKLVAEYVPTMVELTRELWKLTDTVDDPVLVAHGYSPGRLVAEVAERALEGVILPGLGRVGVLN